MTKFFLFFLLLVSGVSFADPKNVDLQGVVPKSVPIQNAGFEQGTAKWTASGGTFTTTTTAANVGSGTSSASFLPGAANNILSNQYTVPSGLYGHPCIVSANLKGGDSSYTLQVISGTPTVLAQVALTGALTNYTSTSIAFTCPTSGTVAVKLLSSGAGAQIYMDDVYVGDNFKTGTVLNSVVWSGYHNSSCSWARTNTAYGDPSAPGGGCALVERQNINFGTVTGYGATSGASALPGIVFTPTNTGTFLVCAQAFAAPNVTAVGATNGIQIADGANVQQSEAVETGLISGDYQAYPNCTIVNVTSLSAYTIKLQTKSSAGTLTLGGNGGSAIEWTVVNETQNMPIPTSSGTVSTGSTPQRIETVQFGGTVEGDTGGSGTCSSDPCTIYRQSGGISVVNRRGTGDYSIHFSPAFSSTPACTAMELPAGTSSLVGVSDYPNATDQNSSSLFAIRTIVISTTNPGNAALSVICVGAK